MADARLEVTLDGQVIHDGSFVAGFSKSFSIAPGSHTIETAIQVGFVKRRRRYEFDIALGTLRGPMAEYVARLAYSRFWGNFASKLVLSPPTQ